MDSQFDQASLERLKREKERIALEEEIRELKRQNAIKRAEQARIDAEFARRRAEEEEQRRLEHQNELAGLKRESEQRRQSDEAAMEIEAAERAEQLKRYTCGEDKFVVDNAGYTRGRGIAESSLSESEAQYQAARDARDLVTAKVLGEWQAYEARAAKKEQAQESTQEQALKIDKLERWVHASCAESIRITCVKSHRTAKGTIKYYVAAEVPRNRILLEMKNKAAATGQSDWYNRVSAEAELAWRQRADSASASH